MRIIERRENGSPREVRLTDEEVRANGYFHRRLDQGASCVKAAEEVAKKYDVEQAFLDWLVG